MARITSNSLARLLLVAPGALAAINVDVENAESVRSAAAVVAGDLMSFYNGNETGQIPGILPSDEYYPWTGGVLWNTLLDYRARSGDTKFDSLISQGLLWQKGPHNDYLAPNWTASTGNDDQAMWALAALSADETGFQEPSSSQPQWLTLAKNVFDEQSTDARRADDGKCEGLLRWQLFPSNNGYNYINAISNIAYLNLGARLALATGNKTYSDLAEDTYELLTDVGFVTKDFNVYDGAQVDNCDSINKVQFTYSSGMLLHGFAALYNQTGDGDWKEAVDGLTNRILELFFPDGVAIEVPCEEAGTCNTDMTFLKGILHRSLASTVQLAPYTSSRILPVLKSSAKAAVSQCTGGDNGRMCGLAWSTGKFDGKTGAGQQMSVLSALVSIMDGQSASVGTGSESAQTNGGSPASVNDGNGGDNPASGMGARAGASLGAVAGAMLAGRLVLYLLDAGAFTAFLGIGALNEYRLRLAAASKLNDDIPAHDEEDV
ncbi:hypothetical protein AAE478_002130 [Parahypoxylon ruwenzoriense]